MKKSTKIIIGAAIFVVMMGLIITAVVLAVLTGKQIAELYKASYLYVSDYTVDGTYIAVDDDGYFLAREGKPLGDNYATIEYVGDGKFFYRDTFGGCGFLGTDGKPIVSVRGGTKCIYAESGYAVLVETAADKTVSVVADDFTHTLGVGEEIVDDYRLLAALPRGFVLTKKAGQYNVYYEGGSATYSTIAPTGVRGYINADGKTVSLYTHTEISDAVAPEPIYAGAYALQIGDKLYFANGNADIAGCSLREVTQVIGRETAVYARTWNVIYDTVTGVDKIIRDGALVDVGRVFASINGLFAVETSGEGSIVKDIYGSTLRAYAHPVEPVGIEFPVIDAVNEQYRESVKYAFAVQYTGVGAKSGEHYIEPLDGNAFACPVGTAATFDGLGETVYLGKTDGKVTLYRDGGKKVFTFETDATDKTVRVYGKHIAVEYTDGKLYLDGATEIDGIALDGNHAFKVEPHALTVIEAGGGAKTYYTMGAAELTVSKYGTVVRDGGSGLYGYISTDGKLTVPMAYTSLEAHNSYLKVGLESQNGADETGVYNITDFKGKQMHGSVVEATDLGKCSWVRYISGESKVVDVRGREILSGVTAKPEKLAQRAVIDGVTTEAAYEKETLWKLTAGSVRVLRGIA